MQDIIPTPNKLRFYRERAGFLQREVADALGLDCMDRISRWENGLNMPSIVNLFKLADVYKTTPRDLYPELVKTNKQEEHMPMEL
jgi:transcriptional regulator with XRE-family HTH domain